MCMFQSLYMSCDVHFFLIAPFIIWILRKQTMFGIVTLSAIVILLTFILSVTVYFLKQQPILIFTTKYLRDPVVDSTFQDIYIPSHLRAVPFFIGMIAGYIKHKMKSKDYKMSKYIVCTGWMLCVILSEVTYSLQW